MGLDSVFRSDAEEDVSAIHPVERVPVDQQGETAEDDRLQPGAEEVQQAVAEVGSQGGLDEVFPEVRDQVSGDGVHADDDEREGQAAVAPCVDVPGEGGEKVEADASAEEGPGRSPDALDDGIDSEDMEQHARGDQRGACEEHPAEGDSGCGGDEPSSGDKTEQHGTQCGDEAEGEIAAGVVEEGRGSGKEIQEPEIEGLAEVYVLVPVCGESMQKVRVPLRGNADLGVVEADGRQGIEGPRQPVAEEDGTEGDPLPSRFREGEQEGEGVAEPDLGEGVFKGEVGEGLPDGSKEDSEGDEDEAAEDGVGDAVGEALALSMAAADGVGKSDPHEKGEGGLNEIVQAEPGPFDVGLVEGEDAPEEAVGIGSGDRGEAQDLGHHEQHDEAAVGVDGYVARRLLRLGLRRFDVCTAPGMCHRLLDRADENRAISMV